MSADTPGEMEPMRAKDWAQLMSLLQRAQADQARGESVVEPEDEKPSRAKEVEEFNRSLRQESDRGCVLAAAAYLDESLRQLIAARLVEDKKVVSAMFKGTGPLATFSACIDLAYALGMVSKLTRREMHRIREIRNRFAHSPTIIGFSDRAISDRCKELSYALHNPPGPRRQFIRSVIACLGTIDGEFGRTVHIVPLPSFDPQELARSAEQLREARDGPG